MSNWGVMVEAELYVELLEYLEKRNEKVDLVHYMENKIGRPPSPELVNMVVRVFNMMVNVKDVDEHQIEHGHLDPVLFFFPTKAIVGINEKGKAFLHNMLNLQSQFKGLPKATNYTTMNIDESKHSHIDNSPNAHVNQGEEFLSHNLPSEKQPKHNNKIEIIKTISTIIVAVLGLLGVLGAAWFVYCASSNASMSICP